MAETSRPWALQGLRPRAAASVARAAGRGSRLASRAAVRRSVARRSTARASTYPASRSRPNPGARGGGGGRSGIRQEIRTVARRTGPAPRRSSPRRCDRERVRGGGLESCGSSWWPARRRRRRQRRRPGARPSGGPPRTRRSCRRRCGSAMRCGPAQVRLALAGLTRMPVCKRTSRIQRRSFPQWHGSSNQWIPSRRRACERDRLARS